MFLFLVFKPIDIISNKNFSDHHVYVIMQVKRWVTVNEPQLISQYGYGGGPQRTNISFPPGVIQWLGFADYLSQHHMLLAHAQTYRLYEKEFKKAQRGTFLYLYEVIYH